MNDERKCFVLKNGKLLMANKNKARKFNGNGNAVKFIKNLILVSTKQKLTITNFEILYQ